MSKRPGQLLRFAFVSAVALVTACSSSPGTDEPMKDRVTIRVAPLDLPGTSRVCYDLRVTNAPEGGGDVVWSAGEPGLNGGLGDDDALCSDRYGNGDGGEIAYVGACDASGQEDPETPEGERTNSVTLWLDGLYDDGNTYLDPSAPGVGWQNPCAAPTGCTLEVLCSENADAQVAFDLTILREARQGFFDVAVSFEDILCSAKLDTCNASNEHIELLHGADGDRDWTAVFGFACTAGVGVDVDTMLLYSDVRVECGDATFLLDPAADPGNNDVTVGGTTLHYGVYRGAEALACDGAGTSGSCNKLYWNLAVSLDDLAGFDSCRLYFSATANDDNEGFDSGLPVGAGRLYPYIDVDAVLAPAACQRSGIDEGGVVSTVYHGNLGGVPAPVPMCTQYDGELAEHVPDAECGATCTDGDTRVGPTSCGANGRGYFEQDCIAGGWVDNTTCVSLDRGFWVVNASVSTVGYASMGFITNLGYSETCPADAIDPTVDGDPGVYDPREELTSDASTDLGWADPATDFGYPLGGFLSRTWCIPALPSDVDPAQFPGLGYTRDGIVDTVSIPPLPDEANNDLEFVSSRPAFVELVADGVTWTIFAAGFELDFYVPDYDEATVFVGRKVAIGQAANVNASWFLDSPTYPSLAQPGVIYGPVGGRVTFGEPTGPDSPALLPPASCWAVHGCVDDLPVTFTGDGSFDLSSIEWAEFGGTFDGSVGVLSAGPDGVVVVPPSLSVLADLGWRYASLTVPVLFWDTFQETLLARSSFTYRAEPIVDTAVWSYATTPSGTACGGVSGGSECPTGEVCYWDLELCVPTVYRLDAVGTGFQPGMEFTFDDPQDWNHIYMFQPAGGPDPGDWYDNCLSDSECNDWIAGTVCRREYEQDNERGICAFPDAGAVTMVDLTPTSFSLLLDTTRMFQDGEGYFGFELNPGNSRMAQVRNPDYDGWGGWGGLLFDSTAPLGTLTVWRAIGLPFRGVAATQTIVAVVTNLGGTSPSDLVGVTGTIAPVIRIENGVPIYGAELPILGLTYLRPSPDTLGAHEYTVTLPGGLTSDLYRLTLTNAAGQSGVATFATQVRRTPYVANLWNETTYLRQTVDINPWQNYCASNECIPNAESSSNHCPPVDAFGHGACTTSTDCRNGRNGVCVESACRYQHLPSDQCQGAGFVVHNVYVSTYSPNFALYDPVTPVEGERWLCSAAMGVVCENFHGAVVRLENYDPALDTLHVVDSDGVTLADVTAVPFLGSDGRFSGLYRLAVSPTASLGNVTGFMKAGELIIRTGGVRLECSSLEYLCVNAPGNTRNPVIAFVHGRIAFGNPSGDEDLFTGVFIGVGSLNGEFVLPISSAYVPSCANAHLEGSPYYVGDVSIPGNLTRANNNCVAALTESRLGSDCYLQLESGGGFSVWYPGIQVYFALQTMYCTNASYTSLEAWEASPGEDHPTPQQMFQHALGTDASGTPVVLW